MAYCNRCDRYFSSDDALWQHERMSSRHWICHDCGKDFPSERGLTQHYVQSPRHHYCQRCDSHFDTPYDLQDHYVSDHWYCSLCNKIFDSKLGLQEHNRQSHWYCATCGRSFASENNLMQHKRTHLPKTVQCPGRNCTRAFASHADLVLHWESGTCPSGVTRQLVNDTAAKNDRYRLITDARRLIQGPDGGYTPRGSVTTWATQASWNGSAYECVLCHCTYPKLARLNEHLQSPVHDERMYKCPTALEGCAAQFRTLSAVVQHIESGKCGVRKFQRQIQGVMDDLTSSMHRLTC
ncbi:uncharacterized protein PHACADRAFT_260453 [Phanerochaete carnosa HHB-10118-sp]|uniref:C2H2-type domain-containing protein n=1 Tax=Phanerochaete carnosa (strain HHB-10118-sp) TaxID=650164 RepID=K5VLC8_PHACS|nr:uncharacterized protein PHACADRAFT_260453 [Phanerochaete carnosa HHB-10118-sp]EKM52223.1 hypothetical protein PHACADRAFT_260453 [Phanerochaete carnosa HHB-10118-sp]